MIIGHKYITEAMVPTVYCGEVGEHSSGVEGKPEGLLEPLEKQM